MSRRLTMLLSGTTNAELQGSAPAVTFREQHRRHPRFHVRTTDGGLVLRCWPRGRFEPGWSLKARVHPEPQGVRLEGRIRARSELLVITLFGGLSAAMAALGVAGVAMHQPAAGFPLIGTLAFLVVAAILIRKRGAAMNEREALAWQYLQSLHPSGHQ